jgi:FtsP/CotA-like multicopper oxidase with cupredoxin domain
MAVALGPVEAPFIGIAWQTSIPTAFRDPPTEILNDKQVQWWKITHNGVDTHPIHFHLLNVQIVNRVAWDNSIRPPDANELGWQETIRMNPLEDIIVARQPKLPTVPFLGPTAFACELRPCRQAPRGRRWIKTR